MSKEQLAIEFLKILVSQKRINLNQELSESVMDFPNRVVCEYGDDPLCNDIRKDSQTLLKAYREILLTITKETED